MPKAKVRKGKMIVLQGVTHREKAVVNLDVDTIKKYPEIFEEPTKEDVEVSKVNDEVLAKRAARKKATEEARAGRSEEKTTKKEEEKDKEKK